MWTRRFFLGAAAAAAASADAPLAIDGGAPVRSTPLRSRHFGPLYYDESEWQHLLDVFRTRSPFRFWNFELKAPPKVSTFEREFAERMQVKYALAVNAGTTALETALAALGVGPGDEVVLPAWTWHSCYTAVVRSGGLPVLAEVDESFNLDPKLVEKYITAKTKVLMAVHLQGNPADMDSLLAIARKRKIKLLEDCSQSVGASYRGKPVGSVGDIAIASLQVNKTISAGEGGAVYTSDAALFERAVRFHDVGTLRPVHQQWLGQAQGQPFVGSNFRMNEFTGGVLLAQVRKLPQVVGDIRSRGQRVYEALSKLPGVRLRGRPDAAGDLGSFVAMGFPDKARRDRFLAAMKAEGVPCSPPFGSVFLAAESYVREKRTHAAEWPSFSTERGQAMKYSPDLFPQTAGVLDRFAGVSLDPKHSDPEIDDVIAAIRKVYPRIAAG
jgi:8-amino-3,8-dideoxy-alpha-D-manno-octulosonate transaminase